ncbi:MAG: HAD family hydrolase [Gemmatimonadota bacterium]
MRAASFAWRAGDASAVGGGVGLNVLVFDIDGTLTETNRVDGHYFKSAIQAAIPSLVLESFSGFVEMTDTAILRQIVSEQGLGDYERIEEVVQHHFVRGLRDALEDDPRSFTAVAGAPDVFSAARHSGWVPAVATGGWRPSAELKLEAAGIPMRGVPLATASEADRRVEIIRLAVAAACGGTAPSEVVYVGDGSWDARACRELGIGFIGRAESEQEIRLRQLGARVVLPDFLDPGALRSALAVVEELRLSEGEA